jgi:hypothetical protein
MSTFPCPKGHESTEADFCSVCGVKMQAAASASPVIDAASTCPDCGAPRDASGGIFCEICGYNFSTGAHGELKPDTLPPTAAPAIRNDAPLYQVVITVDPALRAAESPEAPADFAPLTVRLDKESNLIGRRSDRRGVFPEISLDRDDAVSHRHALISRLPGGGLILRDIGSSNGTSLNGTGLQPMTDAPLKDGDRITLGHWTRMVIQSAGAAA